MAINEALSIGVFKRNVSLRSHLNTSVRSPRTHSSGGWVSKSIPPTTREDDLKPERPIQEESGAYYADSGARYSEIQAVLAKK